MPRAREAEAPNTCLSRLFQLLSDAGRKPGNFRFYTRYLFDGVDLAGKSMLDVGAGDGRHSLYAACLGATRVVALEPEVAGSVAGEAAGFRQAVETLGLGQVEVRGERLQEYAPGDAKFDVILLHSSINHLDEDACTRLLWDPAAREAYRRQFEKLAGLSLPGATLIAVDGGRKNLYPRLGLPNPIAPWIEWEKHQQPEVWAELLGDAGFEAPRIRWNSFNTFRSIGRLLLGNRFAAYVLLSTFCLTMTRSRHPEADLRTIGVPEA